jgi:transposase
LRRGSFKKNGGQASQALGRSRGGFSTKIHANVDALGNPLRFLLTGGQRHDITQANGLIADFDFERVIADRSYDSDEFLDRIAAKQAEAVIPPRKNRTEPRDYDHHLYKERHLIECFFNKIKHYRRLFSRFEKLDQRLLGFLSFAGKLFATYNFNLAKARYFPFFLWQQSACPDGKHWPRRNLWIALKPCRLLRNMSKTRT